MQRSDEREELVLTIRSPLILEHSLKLCTSKSFSICSFNFFFNKRCFRSLTSFSIPQGGPDITCQKNSGSLEGSKKSGKPRFIRSKIMGLNFHTHSTLLFTKVRKSLSSERLVDIEVTKFYIEKVPCEQQVLIELVINSGDFW
jgi:hypothetical protein